MERCLCSVRKTTMQPGWGQIRETEIRKFHESFPIVDAIKRLLRHTGNRDMGVNYSRQTQGAVSRNARTLSLFPVIREKRCFKDSSYITGRILIRAPSMTPLVFECHSNKLITVDIAFIVLNTKIFNRVKIWFYPCLIAIKFSPLTDFGLKLVKMPFWVNRYHYDNIKQKT